MGAVAGEPGVEIDMNADFGGQSGCVAGLNCKTELGKAVLHFESLAADRRKHRFGVG